MAATFTLEIATPERLVVREDVTEAQIPAKRGDLGVRPEHAPPVAELGSGVLSYVSDCRRREMSVGGGVVEVLPERTRVLADTAEKPDEIDVKRAEESIRRASERLAGGAHLGVDVARALNALRR